MALSFTPISALNKSSFLRPFGDELVIAATSGSSMAGKTIYVWIGMFVNSYDALPDLTTIPTKGWVVAFPASGTVEMGKQLNSYSYQWENIGVTLQRTGTTTMNITPYGLMTMDQNELSNNIPLDSLDILTKNSIINGTPFDNTSPSVYNSDKYLRVVVYVVDGTDIDETGYIDIEITSRFIEKGLYNVVSEFSNFNYFFSSLTIAGIDPGFSLNSNTSMRFILTGTWTAGGWIAIMEINGNNNAQYYTDNNLSMVYFDGAGGISEASSNLDGIISEAAFVSVSAVTSLNGSSTNKYIDVVFDKDYFTKDKQYYIFLIPVKTNDYSNTFVTDILEVTDFVVPTYGDSIEEMNSYTFDDVPYTKCATQAVIHEPIDIQNYQDKATYNAAIVTNESFGTFDSNIQGVRVFIGDMAVPNGTRLDYTTVEEITAFTLVNDSEKYGVKFELQPRPEWAGTLKYITFEYNFSIPMFESAEVTDLIYRQYTLHIDPYETDNSKINITQVLGTVSGENPTKICGDNNEKIYVYYTIEEPGSYHAIAYLEGLHEIYESGSGEIEKTSNPLITKMVTEDGDGGGTTGLIIVDSKNMVVDKEYCLEIIAIKDDHIEGECNNEDVDVTLTLVGGKQLKVEYSATNNIKQVEIIVRPFTTKPGLGNQYEKKFVFTDQSGESILFPAVNGILLFAYQVTVTMKMETNCLVQGTSIFNVDIIGFADNQLLTLEPI